MQYKQISDKTVQTNQWQQCSTNKSVTTLEYKQISDNAVQTNQWQQ